MQKIKNNNKNNNKTTNDVQEIINQGKFSEAISLLFAKQQTNWPLLKEGLTALAEIKTNKFIFDGYEIWTQFNPKRIISTMANVSSEAIKNRKCFLCAENLPEKQEGIVYENYSILFNPYPIFPEHLTICSLEHKPQRIKNFFSDFLKMNKDFSDFTLLYNGPESGASAPDHLHFQACKKKYLPVNNDYDKLKSKFGEKLLNNMVSVYGINDGIRKFISIESSSINHLMKTFNLIYDLYSNVSKSHVEPMMNILSSYEEGSGWRIIIFFRKKHRPDAYFAEDDSNILVSPASIDFGGVFIVPLEKDFNKIDKDSVKQIYREVAMGKEAFEYLKTKLKGY